MEVQPRASSADCGAQVADHDRPDSADALAVAALALSRRFAAGATMWCVAPEWPEHARHVAVEFVHPVLVGKRALPAVSVDSPTLVPTVRALVGAGDVVLMMSTVECAAARDVLRRARAWGATTIWLGVGHGGESDLGDLADHVVWVGADDGGRRDEQSEARHDGRLVLHYHVLWELTHVCFEHDGIQVEAPGETCSDEVCITCSDEGRVGEVIDIDERGATRVRTARGVEIVDTSIIADVTPGDLLLIHAGTAIAEVP